MPETTHEPRSGQKIVTTSPDPTANVLDLVQSAIKRLDDLRDADGVRYAEQGSMRVQRMTELMEFHRQFDESQIEHVEATAALRAEYAERLAIAEAKRIDAIRAVDVNAVSVASQRASDQATVLATQVASSAEALRSLVATTAAAVAQSQQTLATSLAQSQQNLATTLSDRLTKLEQAQSEAKGRTSYMDPERAEMIIELKSLRESRASSTGKGLGMGQLVGIIVGSVAFISTLLGIVVVVMRLAK